jgi:hypothetical protein
MPALELPRSVLDAADVSAISQLIILERESRDQQRWKTMRQCFHDDALIRISWITGTADEFVNGSIDMAKRGLPAKHRLGPILVRLGGDRAVASLSGIIDIAVEIDGVEAQLSSYARFFYKARRREGRWKLSGFDGAYVRDELVPTVPGQQLTLSPEALTPFRKSYRLLSFVLSRNGYVVNGDLPGDDRPETVHALESELFAWAGV